MQNFSNDYSISPSFYYTTPIQYFVFLPVTTPTIPISPPYSETSFQTFEHSISNANYFMQASLESPYVEQTFFSPPSAENHMEKSQEIQIQSNDQRELSKDGSLQKDEMDKSKVSPFKRKQERKERKDRQISSQKNVDLLVSNIQQSVRQYKIKVDIPLTEDDKQYFPKMERKKKMINKYQENENRNIVSNQINQIFSFVQKKAKSGRLVQKIMKKYPQPPAANLKRFYLYQTLLKNKLGHYANEKSLKLVTEIYEPKCESWCEQEQRYYNKISRILINHFLHEDSIFIILTSKRMKSEKKNAHLRARRYVAEQALTIIRGY